MLMHDQMSARYAQVLAEPRSCLSALADLSPYDSSMAYEHLLLDVDELHGGRVPALHMVTGTLADLRCQAEAWLAELADLGADPLTIELLLVRLDEVCAP